MAALLEKRYDLNYFKARIMDGFICYLDKSTIDIVQKLADQVGAPEYIRTPQFPKREKGDRKDRNRRRKNKGVELSNEAWEAIRNFEVTQIKKSEGINKSIDFVRIGTCGALKSEIDPGSYIISKYAIGLDGVAGFYEINYSDDEKDALERFYEETGWHKKLNPPYIKKSGDELFNLLSDGANHGITVTANGFYGPQGRSIRIPLSLPDFKENLRQFSWNSYDVMNLEMETSALYALSNTLGHNAVTICLVLANRYSNKFLADYQDEMKSLIVTVLDKLSK